MYGLIRAAFVFAILQAGAVCAQSVTITFDSCRDAKGHAVQVLADPTIKEVVSSAVQEGKPVIRYNPGMLPQMLPESRHFLFAHECARHYLGLPVSGTRTLAQAQRADCEAVATLVRSGLLAQAGDAAAIEQDLALVTDWSVLPGPQRSLNLSQCQTAQTRGSMALPVAPAKSEGWSKCVQACGSKLYACGRAASCQSAYDDCSKRCGE